MLAVVIIIFILGYYLGYRGAQGDIDSLRNQLAEATKHHGRSAHKQVASTSAPAASIQEQQIAQEGSLNLGQDRPMQQIHVDNAVLLLYFGAFLFLSAVGLFMAFGGLDGISKSLLVGLLILAFYGSGLYLYKGTKRLKPAGITFIGTGLILMPFLGLALHIFVFNRESGPAVWALTSVLAAILYVHALLETRQVYVTYFLLGAVLSLFESSIAITELPVFYSAWVMTFTGILFLLVAKWKGLWPELQESLQVSSSLLVPLSLLMTVAFAPVHGLWQTSLGFMISAFYYWLAAYLEKSENLRAQLIAVADILSISTLLLMTYHFSEDLQAVSVVAILLAATQMVLLLPASLKRNNVKLHIQYLAVVTAVLPVVSLMFALSSSTLFITILGVTIAIHAALYLLYRNVVYLTGSLVGIMAFPLVAGIFVADPDWDPVMFVAAYGFISALCFALRLALKKDALSTATCRSAFYIALCGVAIAGLAAGLTTSTIVLAGLSVLITALSYYESPDYQRPLFALALALQHLTAIFGTLALTTNGLEEMRQAVLPAVFIVLGLLQYAAAYGGLVSTSGRQRYLRYAAVASGVLGAGSIFVYGESNLLMIVNLAMVSVFMYLEGNKDNNQDTRDVALGVGMAALQWLLFVVEIRNFQIYSHLWALFFAFLAFWRSSLGQSDKEQGYTILALSVLTLPLAVQALGDQGELYGWLLIVEHISIMLLGMLINRPLVKRWGLWVSVAAVLYQLRSLTYLALGFLAVVVIVIALRVLQKNNDQNE
jgi:hypothetical protein